MEKTKVQMPQTKWMFSISLITKGVCHDSLGKNNGASPEKNGIKSTFIDKHMTEDNLNDNLTLLPSPQMFSSTLIQQREPLYY